MILVQAVQQGVEVLIFINITSWVDYSDGMLHGNRSRDCRYYVENHIAKEGSRCEAGGKNSYVIDKIRNLIADFEMGP